MVPYPLHFNFVQDDLHIVDKLDIPTNDSQYLLDLAEARKWGPSVLFVDVLVTSGINKTD